MKLPIAGGCLCGAVRYTLRSAPKGASLCHCRSCQRATGSAYFPFLFVTEGDLDISGQVTEFTSTGASGKQIHRGFCGKCGSTVFGRLDIFPGFRTISASSLDDPAVYSPEVDMWVKDKQHWDYLNPALKKFDENPG